MKIGSTQFVGSIVHGGTITDASYSTPVVDWTKRDLPPPTDHTVDDLNGVNANSQKLFHICTERFRSSEKMTAWYFLTDEK